jgi:AraC-like DNA-binding protein
MAHQASNRVRTWLNPHLGGTLCLHADFRKQRFDRHFHEEFAIGIIDSGCQAFVYDHSRRMDMPGGTIALIMPGIVHAGWSADAEGWRYRMLYPPSSIVSAAVQNVFGSDRVASFNRPVVHDKALYTRLAKLHAASEDPLADGLEVEAHFLAVIRDAFARHAGHRTPSPARADTNRMAVVREVLESRHSEAVTLAELSAAAGVDKFRLLRQFKSVYGLPPHAYLRHVRISRAREHILAGLALADAAVAVGFADQSHMTRAFRRTVGYTPGALMRALS